jgi:hypothetical protein
MKRSQQEWHAYFAPTILGFMIGVLIVVACQYFYG